LTIVPSRKQRKLLKTLIPRVRGWFSRKKSAAPCDGSNFYQTDFKNNRFLTESV
jgi:hypothetical protein